MGGVQDKFEPILPGAYIAEFKRNAGRIACVRRYFPFEAPETSEPRYRVNLLFQDVGDGKGLQLTTWYFRSPN